MAATGATSAAPSAVVTRLQEMTDQLRRAPEAEALPEWVTWILELHIADPTNPIAQETSVAELLDLLGKHGLKRDHLAKVDELRVTTPRGLFIIRVRA